MNVSGWITVGGMMVVVVALWTFTNVTHHRTLSGGMSKLAFFLRQRLDLGEHTHFLSFRSESKEAESPALGSASGRTKLWVNFPAKALATSTRPKARKFC
jgi:hypothetical protein